MLRASFALVRVFAALALSSAACAGTHAPEGAASTTAGDASVAGSDAAVSNDGDATTRTGTDSGMTSGDDDAANVDASDSSAAPAGPLVAYVGGYSGVIAQYEVDEASGALTPVATTTSFGASPSFLVIDPAATHLYAVDEADTGKVGAYAIGATGALTFLSSVSSGGSGPAFVGLDRAAHFVFVANYNDGAIEILPIASDGTLGAATDSRNAGANAHMMIADPSNRYVFVPCKGSDSVAQYVFDATAGTLMPNPIAATFATAKGAGPRHLAFHPNGKYAYLISENASTLTALTLDTTDGTLTALQTVSTLTGSTTDAGANTGAEVFVHPSGKWVLASNRGDDSLAVFAVDEATGRVTSAGIRKTGGATPRSFAISPSGTFVYAVNQGGDNLVPFAFDETSGALSGDGGGALAFTSPSFVGFARLAAP